MPKTFVISRINPEKYTSSHYDDILPKFSRNQFILADDYHFVPWFGFGFKCMSWRHPMDSSEKPCKHWKKEGWGNRDCNSAWIRRTHNGNDQAPIGNESAKARSFLFLSHSIIHWNFFYVFTRSESFHFR